MPLIQVFSNLPLSSQGSRALLQDLSAYVAHALGKPEKFVMTRFTGEQPMTFGGTEEPPCYIELKSIGVLTP